jgi:hypothetical protein
VGLEGSLHLQPVSSREPSPASPHPRALTREPSPASPHPRPLSRFRERGGVHLAGALLAGARPPRERWRLAPHVRPAGHREARRCGRASCRRRSRVTSSAILSSWSPPVASKAARASCLARTPSFLGHRAARPKSLGDCSAVLSRPSSCEPASTVRRQGRGARLRASRAVIEEGAEGLPEFAGARGGHRNPSCFRGERRCERFVCRKPHAERLGAFADDRCVGFVCREPLAERVEAFAAGRCVGFVCREPHAERLGAFADDRCVGFVCREPLTERLGAFAGGRCEGFVFREPLAERLGAFAEDRCVWFVCRKPLAERLGAFAAGRCAGFVCREPLAEPLGAFAEDRCAWFECRKPLAERLGAFAGTPCSPSRVDRAQEAGGTGRVGDGSETIPHRRVGRGLVHFPSPRLPVNLCSPRSRRLPRRPP